MKTKLLKVYLLNRISVLSNRQKQVLNTPDNKSIMTYHQLQRAIDELNFILRDLKMDTEL